MKRRIIVAALVLVIVITAFSLTACGDDRDWRNPTAGSTVRIMSQYEEFEGSVAATFDDFKSFARSSFGELESSLGDKYTLIYYNRYFFEEHNLITVKFHEVDNSRFYIQSIKKNGNEMTVDLLKSKIGTSTIPTTYCLYIEGDKETRADKIKLNIKSMEGEQAATVTYTGAMDNLNKLEGRFITNHKDLAQYVAVSDNIAVQKYVESYDDEFFASHNLMAVKVLVRPNAMLRVRLDKTTMNVYSYATEHYVNEKTDLNDSSFRVVFLPLTKDQVVTRVSLNKHLEADVNHVENITNMSIEIEQ